MNPIRCFSLLPLLGFALSLAAQNYTPKTLAFTGASDYKTSDLVAITGLTPGKPVTAAEIDVAMQHLVDTGLFSDMRYTVNDQALTFALTPVAADQFLKARYSNFVWWKEDELTPLVHARLPIFTGRVPVTGTIKDEVKDVLAALVLEKGVKASISAMPANGQVSGLVFAIEQPMVEIGEVRVDQVSAAATPRVSELKRRLVGQDYNVNTTGPALAGNLRDTYLDLGYQDIAVDPPLHGAPQISAMAITVDLSTTVHEGALYHVSAMNWPESAIVSKATCAEVAKLKAGDPASRIMVASTVARVTERFAAVGYIDANVTVDTQKDATRHDVAYTFSATPGEQYRVGSVKTPGLTADQQAEFDKSWKMAPGQIYNGDYISTFLQKSGSMKPFQGYMPKYGLEKDNKTHLVALTISFVKRS